MRSLLILPTSETVQDCLREQHAAETALFGVRALSLEELEDQLAAGARSAARAIPPSARSLVIRTITKESPRALGPGSNGAGFRRAIEAFLIELAGGGATVEQLARAGEQLPPWLRARVGALARIASEYQRFLAQRELRDPELALGDTVHASAAIRWPREIERAEEIALVDVVEWTPVRLALLRRLGASLRSRGGRVVVELPHSDQPIAAEAMDPVFRSLEALGDDVEVRARPLRPAPAARSFFTAATASAEAREVGRRIATLIRDGASPASIVIAAHGMDELAADLLHELRPLGLPARVRAGTPMTGTTTWRLARDLASLTDENEITRERVAAIIGSSLVDLSAIASEAPSPLVMIRHLRLAAVRSRASDGGEVDGFQSRLARFGAAQQRNGAKDASLVSRTADAMRRLFARLDEWPPTATWHEHARHLLSLLHDLRIPERLQSVTFAGPRGLRDVIDAEGAANEQEAWAQLVLALHRLEESIELLRLQEQRVTRAELVAWLEQACTDINVGAREPDGSFIELAELQTLAGRRIEHLFIVGAYDGRLPEPVEPDPVLSDDERWQLNEALGRPVLRVTPRGSSSALPPRQLMQTLALALAAETPALSLTLSQPRLDSRGRPLAPSPLVALVMPDVAPEALPFVAVDPRLVGRRSASIDERREAATERLLFFQGAQSAGRFTGLVTALSSTLPQLTPGRVERPWSASALEKMAICGFRFFAESIWRVKEEDEPADQLGPLEMGRLAHLAAEHAVREMVARDQWSQKHLPEALDTGIAAAAKALDAEEHATVLGHPELWAVNRGRMLARLRRMLELEIRETTRRREKPVRYEQAFGMRNAEFPAVEIGGVFVAGQVDRIDAGDYTITVLDYKSGRTEANARKYEEDVLLETQFQLPLYVTALSRVLPQAKHRTVDAGYISLRDGRRTIPLSEALHAKAIRDSTETLEKAVRTLVARVHAGDFPVAPQSCSGCHLRPVCRIPEPEERR